MAKAKLLSVGIAHHHLTNRFRWTSVTGSQTGQSGYGTGGRHRPDGAASGILVSVPIALALWIGLAVTLLR